jgi:hypothetical protein
MPIAAERGMTLSQRSRRLGYPYMPFGMPTAQHYMLAIVLTLLVSERMALAQVHDDTWESPAAFCKSTMEHYITNKNKHARHKFLMPISLNLNIFTTKQNQRKSNK